MHQILRAIFFGAERLEEHLIDLVTLRTLTEVVRDVREELCCLLPGQLQIDIPGQQGKKLGAEQLLVCRGKERPHKLEEFGTRHRILASSAREASASGILRSARTPAGCPHT